MEMKQCNESKTYLELWEMEVERKSKPKKGWTTKISQSLLKSARIVYTLECKKYATHMTPQNQRKYKCKHYLKTLT
jgi:hypothetical protein